MLSTKGNEMSELLKELLIAQALLGGERSARDLCYLVDASVATVKRYLADLRHMGCQIESVRGREGWKYRLGNGAAVQARLGRWIELEQGRTLLES